MEADHTPLLRNGHGDATKGNRNSNRRRLFEHLAGYKPLTAIADHAKIDYDQAFIQSMVKANRMKQAIEMYKSGGFSQSIARLRLQHPVAPRMVIPEGTRIVGATMDGLVIKGTSVEDAFWSTNTEEVVLLVEYETALNQSAYCHVGSLAATNARDIQGCFASQGTIKILDFQNGAPVYEYAYHYNPVSETYNGRTFQGMSTELDMSFGHSKHFEKFEIYYGIADYADSWIEAALDGTATAFSKGNADFSAFDAEQRNNIMLTAPKILNLWMYVVRMMEYATVQCNFPCGHVSGERCDDIPVRAWDQSVAFYTGSLKGVDGNGKGVLLYDLADDMCEIFKTCSGSGDSETGTSSVNFRIMNLYQDGQLALLRRECSRASAIKEQIVNLMTIPLIQGALYSAHVRNFTTDFEEIESATFAASVLPIVSECSRRDAETIFTNLGLGQANQTVDTLSIKQAFENNYACMGITCEDIGGVWEGRYYGQYSFPCNYDDGALSGIDLRLVVILGFILVPCIFVSVFLVYRKRSRQSRDWFCYDDDSDDDMTDDIPENVLGTVNLD
ncbi:hypothetical protein IV203_026278 [Nitzschia inconspicua]|uniref:Uncharacterized protein n=1 Tax=Nitzschia inconspicua TaxID=303405 RepID=A0A9K3LJ01_9STRA|nr:hypothetical protein IV203_006830 [Nitzschia inconspicua]KAG7362918.1 hypothetical protein IV203_026278 [Nitzschia inconspicua]